MHIPQLDKFHVVSERAASSRDIRYNVPEHDKDISAINPHGFFAYYGLWTTVFHVTQRSRNRSELPFSLHVYTLHKTFLNSTQTPPQQFATFPYSLLKTLSMITGELENIATFNCILL